MILQQETVELSTPSGAMTTYVYRPVAAGRYPGLVLFSEILQRSGPIGRTAALLAGHRFVVAVPEIFHEMELAGTILPYDGGGAERGNAHKVGKPIAAFDADVRTALEALAAHPACTGKLGAMGIWVVE